MNAPRVGVIGYGLAGRVFHAPLVEAEEQLQLAAVVTSDSIRAAAVHQRYPSVEVVTSVHELLDRQIDLAIVAAPTPQHTSLTRELLTAGVPTVVDKPLAIRADDAEQLIDLAERRGAPLTVFQNRRWDGDFLTVKSLLEQQAVGKVSRFESRFEWISVRPRPEWKSRTSGTDGGGVAWDLGAHLVDQAIGLFGAVDDVYGELDVRRAGGANDDDAFIALHHRSGVRSHLGMSSTVAQRGFRFRVLGSDAAYTKWGLDVQEAQLGDGVTPADPGYGVEPQAAWGRLGRDADSRAIPTLHGAYPEFYRAVAASVISGTPMPVDPHSVLETLRIIESLHARPVPA